MPNKIIENLFYLFVFFLPWQTVYLFKEVYFNNEKFQYGSWGIYLFEIILLSWILFNLAQLKNHSDKNIYYLLLTFILYTSISIFWSINPLQVIFSLIPLALGVSSFLISQKNPLNFKKFAFVFILSVCLQGILGLNQFLTQESFSNSYLGITQHFAWQGGTSVIETADERYLRAYGGESHPNILGGFLAIAILLGICAYLKATRQEKIWKIFLLSLSLINFFALLVTFSRSALLSLVCGLILLFLYFFYIQNSLAIKNIVLFGFILFLITSWLTSLFPRAFSNRLNLDSRLEHKSIQDRVTLVKEAQILITQNPLGGVGLGNYTQSILEKNKAVSAIWQIQPVHNLYLLIFAELGLLGFSLFLLILFLILGDLFQSIKKTDHNRVIFSILVIILLLISLFDHWVWTAHSGILLFWLLLSFAKTKESLAN